MDDWIFKYWLEVLFASVTAGLGYALKTDLDETKAADSAAASDGGRPKSVIARSYLSKLCRM